MRNPLACLGMALLLAYPASSAAQSAPAPNADSGVSAPAAASFEVVRAGDGAMTCDALIAEINNLNAEVQAMQTRFAALGGEMNESAMAATRRSGASGLGAAAGLASLLPGAGLLAGSVQMLSQQASQAAWQQQQRSIMERTAELSGSLTDMAPRANRAAHLSEIARDRSC